MLSNEQLQQFCEWEFWARSRVETRGISVPFRQGGRIFATDSKLLVHIPDDGRELPVPPGKLPNAAAMLSLSYESERTVAIRDVLVPMKTEPCYLCEGKGEIERLHKGRPVMVDCDECDPHFPGLNEPWPHVLTSIGKVIFQSRMLTRILRVFPDAVLLIRDDRAKAPILWMSPATGISGIVMPVANVEPNSAEEGQKGES